MRKAAVHRFFLLRDRKITKKNDIKHTLVSILTIFVTLCTFFVYFFAVPLQPFLYHATEELYNANGCGYVH
jgi:hypothetical protein